MDHALLLANLASTAAMTGLIWTVQLVHYPSFEHVGDAHWAAFHRRHMRSITWIVAPLMLVELATALALLIARPPAVPAAAAWVGIALVAVAWLTTALVQVPQHRVLDARRDAAVIRALVRGNWVRTSVWTARSALLVWMVGAALGLNE